MRWLTWLFGSNDENEKSRNDRQNDASRKLSPAMPMAGAGAELAGQGEGSETEEALKRASRRQT